MPGSGWNTLKSEEVRIKDSRKKGSFIKINRMFLQKGVEKQLAHYWYQSRGRVVANEYMDRACMILDSVFKKRSDGAFIRITGPGYHFTDDLQKQSEFIVALLKNLQSYLPD